MPKKTNLTAVSLIELKNELAARGRRGVALRRRRAVLAARMAAIDAELAHYSGPAQADGDRSARTRASNDKSLVDTLAEVLKGKTMSVKDAETAVQDAGYVTGSPNFRVLVAQALINKDRFKRVDRGLYTAK